jgi:hypothetical protein
VFGVWQGYKFLETYYVGILLMDIVDNFSPGGRVLIPLIIVKQADIIGKKPDFSFPDNGFFSFRLKLKVFPENIPAGSDGEDGN